MYLSGSLTLEDVSLSFGRIVYVHPPHSYWGEASFLWVGLGPIHRESGWARSPDPDMDMSA